MKLLSRSLAILLILLCMRCESFAAETGKQTPTPTPKPTLSATDTPSQSSTANVSATPNPLDHTQIYPILKFPKSLTPKMRKRLLLACQFNKTIQVVIKKGARYRSLNSKDLSKMMPSSKASSIIKQIKKQCTVQWLNATPTTTPTPAATTTPNSNDPTPTSTVPPIQPTPTATPSPTPSRHLPQSCNANYGVNCPILFNISPEASPGDAINITGGTFTQNTKVFLETISGDGVLENTQPFQLSIVNNHFAAIQARIPDVIAERGVWAVWVEQNGAASNVLFVNRALASHQSTRFIAPGDELTIWGRALSLPGNIPAPTSVNFVSGTTSLPATIVYEDSYRLRVTAPQALLPNVKYSVEISNGSGGALGISRLEDDITAIAKGSDPLNLKVWWVNQVSPNAWNNIYNVKNDPRLAGHYAIGNGLNDDSAAIQFALNLAGSSGGGTVYLPNGIYRITTELAINHSNTILRGAGQGVTTIRYGQAGLTIGAIAFAENNVKFSGIASLTVEDLKASNGNGNASIRNWVKSGIEKIFVHDVQLLLGNQGQTLTLGNGTNHILVSNCDITLTKRQDYAGQNHAALWITEADDVIIRGNTVRYDIGRIQVQSNTHLQLIDNHFIRNGSTEAMADRQARQNESGGVEFSFTKDSVFDDNQVEVSPPPPVDQFNDSEVFMTQGSIYEKSDWGEVSSATSTTITDNALDCLGQHKNWGPTDLNSPLPGIKMVVAIVRGKGLGQWRYLQSWTSNTLTVSRPFDIVPDSSSSYVITHWTVDSPYLLDNRVEGGFWCINFYTGGLNLDTHRNTCIDAGNIQTQGIDIYPGVGSCKDYHRFLAWNVSYTQNQVQSTARRLLPSSIKIQLEQFTDPDDPNHPKMHANSILNSEMRNNKAIAATPNVPIKPPLINSLYHDDGRMYSTIGGAGHPTNGDLYYSDADYGVLATVVSGNTSENYEGQGSFFEQTQLGNKLMINDNALGGAN